MEARPITCPRCKATLATSLGGTLILSQNALARHRVDIECMKCGAVRQWQPARVSGKIPSVSESPVQQSSSIMKRQLGVAGRTGV